MNHSRNIVFFFLLLFVATTTWAENPPSLDWKSPAQGFDNSLCGGKAEDAAELSKFAKNLASNFGALFCPQNATPFYVGLAATMGSFALDRPVKSFFREHDRFEAGGNLGANMGKHIYVASAVGGVFVVGNLVSDTRFRSFAYSLAQGFVINNAITGGTKYLVGRERPDGSDDLSFLSGHTSNAFLFATIASHYYPKATIPAYVAATFVGISRMERSAHHLSDVVAGAALGYIVGQTVSRRSDGALQQRSVQWMPTISPSRKEVGMAVTIQW